MGCRLDSVVLLLVDWLVCVGLRGKVVGRRGNGMAGSVDHESLNFIVGPYAKTSNGPICKNMIVKDQ